MQIDHNILIAYGGVSKKVSKGSFIFMEGDTPRFFFQLVEGEIKVFSTNIEGKEFIQGIFTEGNSFGEPPLFEAKCYPSTAQASTDSVIVKISKEKLLNILQDYPGVALNLLQTFAKRLYHKATSTQILISRTPEEKILGFFNKTKMGDCDGKILIPYTRQEIADFTSLRVETVIRALLKMHEEGKVLIKDHKVYY